MLDMEKKDVLDRKISVSLYLPLSLVESLGEISQLLDTSISRVVSELLSAEVLSKFEKVKDE